MATADSTTTTNLSITIENDTVDKAYSGRGSISSGSGGGGGAQYEDIINMAWVQALFYFLYTTIFVVGLFGNVLVCYVVLRNKAMQSVTNFFITNLALSDILLCVLGVPFTPLYSFMGEWVFGPVLCHLLPFSQGVSVYISTMTLTSIAVDRFFVIIYPFKERMKLSTSVGIIFCIWIFSVLATLPYGIFTGLVYDSDRKKYFCEEIWPYEVSRHAFGASTTILQFVVPFIIMSLCYVKVSLKLSDRAKFKPGAKSSRREEQERERKRRTNRMLIAMVAIFGFSWLPLNIINLLQDVHAPFASWHYTRFLFFIAHAIAMSSTCYNPFVYAWLNENFRKEFKQVLPCFAEAAAKSRNGRALSGKSCNKSCNGNETIHETLLPLTPTCNSPKSNQRERLHGHSTDTTTTTTTMTSTSTNVSYCTANETVLIPLDQTNAGGGQ